MSNGQIGTLVVVGVVILFVVITLAKAVRIVPQANCGLVERLGRYHRTLTRGSRCWCPTSTASDRSSTCASRSSPSRLSP